MPGCCEGRKHLFHCCLMRYLSPVAFQKHLNAPMIEGMLGLHTVWLHYYPRISKLMHFIKKTGVEEERGNIYFKFSPLTVPQGNVCRGDWLRNSGHVWLLITQPWTPLCLCRTTTTGAYFMVPEPNTKYPLHFIRSP